MQLSDSPQPLLDDEPDCFMYYDWMENEDVPRDVTHVKADSSVRVIKDWAFDNRQQLAIVILNDGLEEIGRYAFWKCASLQEIVIPNAVRSIKDGAFQLCTGLTTVTFGEGLREIETWAFNSCESLHEIVIPNAVRTIKERSFSYCSGLMTVTLGEGLEEIGGEAFTKCTSLERILIPPAVKAIHDSAFRNCSNLTSVEFCDEIEEFVSCSAMRDWWNRGLHEKSLSTYCSLVRCSIPVRSSGLAKISSWQVNIHDMLKRIPSISTEGMNAYFDSIDSKIAVYENLLKRLSLVLVPSWRANIYDMLSPIPTFSNESLNAYLGVIDVKLSVYEILSEAPELLKLAIPNDGIIQRVLSYI